MSVEKRKHYGLWKEAVKARLAQERVWHGECCVFDRLDICQEVRLSWVPISPSLTVVIGQASREPHYLPGACV